MAQLFISDLHLHPTRPSITRAFYRFLESRCQVCEKLYILGDFFDSWIGDDNDEPFGHEVAAKLKACQARGTEIYLMHGNRDFLVGEDFAKRAGVTLLADPSVIDMNNTKTLLLHGDSLCTEDTDYMAMRKEFRSSLWQENVLAQPLVTRRLLADQLRTQSKTMSSLKAADIMDVTQATVSKVMLEYNATLMIHGHTHRPDRHTFLTDNKSLERIVLGDWEEKAWCLYVDESTIDLESWDIT